MFVRKPAFAGMFYPEDPLQIKALIEKCFSEGSGKTPYKEDQGKRVLGVIAPHAGYAYSGKTAAYSYYELSKTRPKTVILLGPNHSGVGSSRMAILDFGDYETPLGRVSVNSEISKKLIETSEVESDFLAHSQEHSLEVELPFLQYIYGQKFSIVPIVLSSPSYDDLLELAESITKLDEFNECVIIASSDFTHYGPEYGYTPFKRGSKEALLSHDEKAIDYILHHDAKNFYDLSRKSTICGRDGITVLTLISKITRAKNKFLNYSTSSEVSGDYNNVVAYASISFEKS